MKTPATIHRPWTPIPRRLIPKTLLGILLLFVCTFMGCGPYHKGYHEGYREGGRVLLSSTASKAASTPGGYCLSGPLFGRLKVGNEFIDGVTVKLFLEPSQVPVATQITHDGGWFYFEVFGCYTYTLKYELDGKHSVERKTITNPYEGIPIYP